MRRIIVDTLLGTAGFTLGVKHTAKLMSGRPIVDVTDFAFLISCAQMYRDEELLVLMRDAAIFVGGYGFGAFSAFTSGIFSHVNQAVENGAQIAEVIEPNNNLRLG